MSESDGSLAGEGLPADLSPVIRALRFASDEVQLGLVLEAICQRSTVAEAFCNAVIAHAQLGNHSAKRSVRRPHEAITCLGEQRLQARVSRRLARSRAADVGRVDLRFDSGADWKLAVELKLGSGFGYKQLDGYTNWGPVAAVVRDVSQISDLPRLQERDTWVGAATWLSLLEDLRQLPVESAWSSDWVALLDVVQSDGDFDVGIPKPPEIDAQAALLKALAESVVQHLANALRDCYGRKAETAALGLSHGRVSQDRVWAGFDIRAQDGPWLWIGVRNLWSTAPRLRIDYYTYPKSDWRARRRLREAHSGIERQGFVRRRDGFRFERPIEQLAGASSKKTDRALKIITDVVGTLVSHRVFDVEVERVGRYHG